MTHSAGRLVVRGDYGMDRSRYKHVMLYLLIILSLNGFETNIKMLEGNQQTFEEREAEKPYHVRALEEWVLRFLATALNQNGDRFIFDTCLIGVLQERVDLLAGSHPIPQHRADAITDAQRVLLDSFELIRGTINQCEQTLRSRGARNCRLLTVSRIRHCSATVKRMGATATNAKVTTVRISGLSPIVIGIAKLPNPTDEDSAVTTLPSIPLQLVNICEETPYSDTSLGRVKARKLEKGDQIDLWMQFLTWAAKERDGGEDAEATIVVCYAQFIVKDGRWSAGKPTVFIDNAVQD
jgi:hypothetical protein